MIFRKNIKKLDDSEIIIQYKQTRHKRLVGELFERYSHLVYGLCLKYLKDKSLAEDMLMKIFEKLMNDVLRFDIQSFDKWLYTYSRNNCLMFIRKNNKTLDKEIIKGSLYDNSIDDKIIHERQLQLLEEEVKNLPELQKLCIELFYLQQKSYQQIAKELNIELKKVKSHIQNGKRMLKKNMLQLTNDSEIKSK